MPKVNRNIEGWYERLTKDEKRAKFLSLPPSFSLSLESALPARPSLAVGTGAAAREDLARAGRKGAAQMLRWEGARPRRELEHSVQPLFRPRLLADALPKPSAPLGVTSEHDDLVLCHGIQEGEHSLVQPREDGRGVQEDDL